MSKLIIYGLHAAKEAWDNPNRKIISLNVTQNAASHFAKIKGRPQPKIMQRSQIDKIAPKGSVHQGIAMECEDLPEVDVSDFCAMESGKVIILDQITDPHNIGAILRSACAFDAKGVVLQRRSAPDMCGVLAKAASGGLEHVPIALPTNLARSIETLKDGGFTVIGLAEEGIDMRDIEIPQKVVLILGAEGDGMRRLVKEGCDHLAKLPTTGALSTLNVSNAAAVSLALL